MNVDKEKAKKATKGALLVIIGIYLPQALSAAPMLLDLFLSLF